MNLPGDQYRYITMDDPLANDARYQQRPAAGFADGRQFKKYPGLVVAKRPELPIILDKLLH